MDLRTDGVPGGRRRVWERRGRREYAGYATAALGVLGLGSRLLYALVLDMEAAEHSFDVDVGRLGLFVSTVRHQQC